MHSRIDPFPADAGKFSPGGMARRAALINQIRQTRRARSFYWMQVISFREHLILITMEGSWNLN